MPGGNRMRTFLRLLFSFGLAVSLFTAANATTYLPAVGNSVTCTTPTSCTVDQGNSLRTWSGTPPNFLYAANYYDSTTSTGSGTGASDGGGGLFEPGPGCVLASITGNWSSASTIVITVPNINGVEAGMGINGPGIPPGDTIVSVDIGNKLVTLAANTTQAEPSSVTLYIGGDGGSVIMDASSTPNCWYRTNTNGSVAQFGARCDVTVVTGSGTYTSGASSIRSGGATLSNKSDPGKTIVIPGLNSATTYSILSSNGTVG